jgi:hypothetical protein
MNKTKLKKKEKREKRKKINQISHKDNNYCFKSITKKKEVNVRQSRGIKRNTNRIQFDVVDVLENQIKLKFQKYNIIISNIS